MDKKVDEKIKRFEIPGVRYLFAANGFLGMCVIYALRVNINVAIVAMINGTAVYGHGRNRSESEECRDTGEYGNGSSNGEPLQDGEFVWSPELQGVVLGSFYYGYCVSQIPGGRLAEIFSGKWVFGIGNLVTALLTLLTPLAARHHVGSLIAVRALEGLAQGVTIPAINVLLGRWLPDPEKGVLNTFVIIGINIGTVVAMPLTGFLCRSEFFGGWPSAFYVTGGFGCLWFIVWSVLVSDTPASHPFITKKELEYITANQRIEQNKVLPPIPWLKIAKSVPFWAILITRVCQDWSFYIMVNDLPTFFATILQFEVQKNSFLSSVPHLLQTIVGLFVAFLADLVIRRNMASTNFVRKFCNSVSGFGCALGLLGVCLSGCDVTLNVVFFMYLISVVGFCLSGQGLSLLDISPEYAGTLMGICNTLSNLNGFLSPLFVGALTNEKLLDMHWYVTSRVTVGVNTLNSIHGRLIAKLAYGCVEDRQPYQFIPTFGAQTLHQWRIVFGTTAAILTFATAVFAVFSTSEKQDWARPEKLLVPDGIATGDKSGLINNCERIDRSEK